MRFEAIGMIVSILSSSGLGLAQERYHFPKQDEEGLGLAQEQDRAPEQDEDGIESVQEAEPSPKQDSEELLAQEQEGLGLALEELLTSKGKFKLAFGVTYDASQSDRPIGAFSSIATGSGEVAVPLAIGQSARQYDRLIVSADVRYGLTSKAEIFLQSAGHYSNSRTTENFTHSTETSEGVHFLNAVAGLNYRFWEDGKYPGLIGFADVVLAENVAPVAGAEFIFGRLIRLGFTTYKVIDPIVLSLTTRYSGAFPRDTSDNRLDPGDSITLDSSTAFAANNELTLTGGLSMRFQWADRIDGVALGSDRIRADMRFGIAYALDQKTTLRINARTDVIGEDGLTVSMNLTRKFGGETLF